MTVTLKPEQERILIEAINSGLAHSAAEALDQALDALRSRLPESQPEEGVRSCTEMQTNEAKAQAFEKWARNHPARPPLPEAAFRRENLIRDAR